MEMWDETPKTEALLQRAAVALEQNPEQQPKHEPVRSFLFDQRD